MPLLPLADDGPDNQDASNVIQFILSNTLRKEDECRLQAKSLLENRIIINAIQGLHEVGLKKKIILLYIVP